MHGSEQSAVERVATPATPYRPDIDGLRAFAVLAVVLFHVGLAPVSGGYIGVDVFFVISGYLITRLIVNEFAASGRIAFGAFYVRRLRRLFPAMLTTTIASLIAAFIMFSPEQLATFGASAIAAVFSVSNIYFWQQADYFDISAHSKPLLHTWSLSVEEQFYMVLPATLYLLMRSFGRAGWPLAMLIIAIASLIIAEVQIPRDAEGAFYLLPARICEFSVGSLLVWLEQRRFKLPPLGRELLLALGIALMTVPAFTYTPQTRFPGLSAMIVCLGAGLTIYAG
ncbi:MAG: acyltransferase family protein, partial [Hyphomicrobium sp.]